MAQFFKVKTEINNVNVSDIGFGYVLIDDDLADGNTHRWSSDTAWAMDAADAMEAWVDDKIGPWWKKIPQYRYNRYEASSQMVIEILLPLLENHLHTSAKPLPNVFSETTTFANVGKIGNVSFTSRTGVFFANSVWNSCDILDSSPLHATVLIRWSGGYNNYVSFIFTVLNSRNIKNGKLHFESGDKYSTCEVQFWRDGSGFRGLIMVGVSNVPNSWITDLSDNVGVSESDDDPYGGDDSEGDEGGGSNWDDESEENPLPPDPSISAVDTGFITLFKPSVQELKNLANYLWSGAFDIATFKKIFADPMDCILGLSIVPVAVPTTGGTVSVGNISTGVSMARCTTQYVTVNCGTVFLKESRKSYLDYAPYSKLSIFLPYCGMFDLNIDEFQSEEGVHIGVKYKVDILSGGCVAFVFREDTVVQEHSGQCSMSIPITSHDFTNTIQALCSTIGEIGGFMSSVGGSNTPTPTQIQGRAIQSVSNIASTVAAAKPTVQKGGTISGANGILSLQRPFILLERPKLSAPSYQNAYTGYPCNKTLSVGSCSGFTQFQMIHLDGIPMTDEERNELENLVLGGIIV